MTQKNRDKIDAVQSRVENWKFSQALRLSKWLKQRKGCQEVYSDIRAMKVVFEDIGWVSGAMGEVISIAAQSIIERLEECKRH